MTFPFTWLMTVMDEAWAAGFNNWFPVDALSSDQTIFFSLLYTPIALSHTYDWVLSMVGPSDMFDWCDGCLTCLCQILWKWVNCGIRFVM